MKQFKVRLPSLGGDKIQNIIVQARDGIDAFHKVLKQTKDPFDTGSMLCDYLDDGGVRVTEPSSERVVEISLYVPGAPARGAASEMPDTQDVPAVSLRNAMDTPQPQLSKRQLQQTMDIAQLTPPPPPAVPTPPPPAKPASSASAPLVASGSPPTPTVPTRAQQETLLLSEDSSATMDSSRPPDTLQDAPHPAGPQSRDTTPSPPSSTRPTGGISRPSSPPPKPSTNKASRPASTSSRRSSNRLHTLEAQQPQAAPVKKPSQTKLTRRERMMPTMDLASIELPELAGSKLSPPPPISEGGMTLEDLDAPPGAEIPRPSSPPPADSKSKRSVTASFGALGDQETRAPKPSSPPPAKTKSKRSVTASFGSLKKDED